MNSKLSSRWNFIHNHYVQFILIGVLFTILQIIAPYDLFNFGWVGFMRAIGTLMINTIIVMGFYILLGHAGLASLGTAGFVGMGAYLTGYFVDVLGIPTEITLIIVVIIAIILGLLIGFISLRIEGMYLAIVTLGLSEAFVAAANTENPITNGVNGLGIGIAKLLGFITLSRETMFYVIVVFFVLFLIITVNISKSPTGRALLTMKNSESAAQSMGVSLLRYRLLAFVIATIYSMVAGFLYILYMRFSTPTSWSLALSLNILAAVVIGGTKSIWGILSGSFLIFGLNDIVLQNIELFRQNPSITIVFNGLLMILIVMFYPGGISQFYIQMGIKYRTWKAKRGAQHG